MSVVLDSFKLKGANGLPAARSDTGVDKNILEYLYVTKMDDILKDEPLVRLIDGNGFYKTSFCEAHGLKEITVIIDGVKSTWYGPPSYVPSNLLLFDDKNVATKGVSKSSSMEMI